VLVVGPVVVVVVDVRDAPDDRAVATGEEQALVGVLPERVHLRVEDLELADAQRRHPALLTGVLAVRVVDELPDGRLRCSGLDHYRAHGRVRSLPVGAPPARTTRSVARVARWC